MKCENYFCIYESKGSCILKEISLDVTGTCNDCIYPPINRELLNKEKRSLIRKLDFQNNQ